MWEPQPGDTRTKIVTATVLKRCVRILRRLQHAYVSARAGHHNRAERLIEKLSDQGTEFTLIVRRNSYATEQLYAPSRNTRVRRLAHFELALMPSQDERFRPLRVQSWIIERIDATLDRLQFARDGAVVQGSVDGRQPAGAADVTRTAGCIPAGASGRSPRPDDR